METPDLLVMMLALPPVGLAGCLRWYVSRAAEELDDFQTLVARGPIGVAGVQEPAEPLPARH